MSTQMDLTSEIWINSKKPDTLAIYAPKFPRMGFICPACGSIDVFIRWNSPRQVEGYCLDCSHRWYSEQSGNSPYKLD
ncbi:MAG: hypothetical protein ACT4N5_08020 [Nitrosopumilaceae archaeon]